MRKSNIYKNCLITSNILLVISFILVLIFNSKFTYSFYWIVVPLILLFTVLLIGEIDKGKVNKDVKKSSLIKRVFNDNTVILVVMYGAIYLCAEGADIFVDGFKSNSIVVIIYFIITAIYELLLYVTIDNANKETSQLLKNK